MSVETAKRKMSKKLEGVVTSDSMDKTIVVTVQRLVPHPLLGKYIRRYSKYKAHDEKNESKAGDTVRIMETRPISKDKRWIIREIVAS